MHRIFNDGGCFDDGFEYFRNWLISRGRRVFYAAKDNPDTLINEINDDIDEYEFEFVKTGGNELYDF